MTKLLLDHLMNLVNPGPLFFSDCQKLLPDLLAARAWLVVKDFSDPRMHRIAQRLSQLTCFIRAS
jgi:hypothetical protein